MNKQASTARQTWFITGASSGFGLAFARHALAQGHNVVATARNTARLAELAASAPGQVLIQALDVTAAGDAGKAVAVALARFGRIDLLINNAGYGIVGALEETSQAELRAVMETNFFGAVAMTQAVLPQMREQRSGAIVNISSLGGQLSFGGFSAYSASKFALEGMSEALAQEVAPWGIKVLIVEPGAFRTAFAAEALKTMPAMAAYQDSIGDTRTMMQEMHGTQQGDPAKVPAAVDKALQAPNTPLRLQLGADSVSLVRGHAETLLADLAAWESVALDTQVDPAQA
jgi:NAD(P)-dependent dehydrogenase (short-subunit alcohol dehydrogenase family)